MVEIVSQRHVPIPVAKALLDKYLEGYEDNPIITKVYEYLRLFSKCSAEAAEKAMEALVELGFSTLAAAMLVNIVPESVEEARALLGNIDGGYDVEVVEKAVETIREICSGGEEA